MFSRNSRSGHEDDKEQRIHKLEAELVAAQRLIEDQQAILKANLAALADEQEWEPSAPPAHPASGRKPGRSISYSDQPPIKLPNLGLPAVDIAGRVLQAAADRGVVPASSQPMAPTSGDSSPSQHESRPTSESRRTAFTLIVSGFLVVGAYLVALVWSHWQPFAQTGKLVVDAGAIRNPAPSRESPQQLFALSGRTANWLPGPTIEPADKAPESPVAKTLAPQPPDPNSLATTAHVPKTSTVAAPDPKTMARVAAARRTVAHNQRLTPASRPKSAHQPISIARNAKPIVRSAASLTARTYHRTTSLAAAQNHPDHRPVQLARNRYRVTDDPEITPDDAEREAALREEYSPGPPRRPQYYRRAQRRDDYDDYESRRDYERVERRHPRPGRDEQEDRWLDDRY